MSLRFNYFSHVENLTTGILVLTSPFEAARKDTLCCRYATHSGDASVLQQDPTYEGLARWHRLLPFSAEEIKGLQQSCCSFTPLVNENLAYFDVTPNAQLPYRIALPILVGDRRSHAFAISPNSAGQCLVDEGLAGFQLKTPGSYQGSPQRVRLQNREQDLDAADLGPWGNPFRLEAWKCIGLEIAARHPDGILPTLLVADAQGELLAGLVLAAQQIEALSGRTPYRLIAISVFPYNQLATAFEGGRPDWDRLENDDNLETVFPPKPMDQLITNGIMHLMGTVLSLEKEADEAALFAQALNRLVRGRFVDEEDTVYRMQARY